MTSDGAAQEVDRTLEHTLAHIDAGQEASLGRLFELLRIPSISTQPKHAGDCRRAAEWLSGLLDGMGFDASVRDTPGHPIVVAHDRSDAGGPHVLFYGHYDVQPVDPLSLWNTAPFEPVVRDGAIVARGASDDKGQVMTFLEAIRALREAEGKLPVRVSIILEGEEESGGENLLPFLKANAEELRADIALVCDTGMVGHQIPAITTMLRGLVGEEIVISAADRDLHSGIFGNAARNPIHVLADIIAGLRDADGRVTLPGFYDGVTDVPDAVRSAWNAIGLTDEAALGPVGLSIPAGERGYSALEQTWARPSCEVNGITGGYQDPGFKTVLPAKASAKISFRLVAGQQPERIRAAFREFVQSRIPGDCSVEFRPHGGSPASAVPFDGAPLKAALQALGEEWGRPAVTIGSGGSIPVVGELQQALGLNALLVGFARDDDRIHSPNEKYDLDSFQRGIRSWARILHALAAA
ncbi:dipeptidase [Lichenicoccus roseus]|uniref:Dipeptidase n=2 Tax=Lichenicoccus roseus TaxID=2683649 RepID=A0A5R9J1Z7_9PROT|nr:dipeptidase [Lichenicoccus roseus]